MWTQGVAVLAVLAVAHGFNIPSHAEIDEEYMARIGGVERSAPEMMVCASSESSPLPSLTSPSFPKVGGVAELFCCYPPTHPHPPSMCGDPSGVKGG
jgi:hypothetical protein